MMESSVTVCPVPSEQQPLNEYEQLKSAWLFRDCTLKVHQYLAKIAWFWSWSWLAAGPLAAASFPPQKHPAQFLLCGAAGASIGVVLVLVRLYLGWRYVRDRLSDETVFYEESGWYDGQTWIKPQAVLTRDRLVVTYQINPILQRLQITFAILAGLYLAGTILWNLL